MRRLIACLCLLLVIGVFIHPARLLSSKLSPATVQHSEPIAVTDPPPVPVADPASNFAMVRGSRGYWRLVKNADGVWWFLSPAGQPEFLNSVTTVQPTVGARDPDGVSFQSSDWDRSDAGLDHWARATIARIHAMGFKGIGAWSNGILHNYDVPMTHDLNVSAWTRWTGHKLFDPEWERVADMAIESQVKTLRDNRNLVGYYIDNELSWDQDAVGPDRFFDELPPDDPNRLAVMQTIRNVWPTIGEFNRDWKVSLKNFDDLDSWPAIPQEPADAYNRLWDAWLPTVAHRYFSVTGELIRKLDPNHLILGIRYRGAAPAAVVQASRDYTDAQSLNYYVNDAQLDPDIFRTISQNSGQPLIISEYSFQALDGRSGDTNSIGFDAQVLDQRARADAYRLFTTRLARVPFIVGADWFQWMDEPPTGRAGDGEDCNFGVVDVHDHPYDLLAAAVKATSVELDPLHVQSAVDPERDVWRESYSAHPLARIPLLTHAPELTGPISQWPAESILPGVRAAMTVGSERDQLAHPNVYLGWRPEGIYLGFEVFEHDPIAASATGAWWSRDCVEFWFDTRQPGTDQRDYTPDCHHFFFVPTPQSDGAGGAGIAGQWHSPGDALGFNIVPQPMIRQFTRILPDRYVTQMFIPAALLHGFDPKTSPVLGFNIDLRNYRHAAEFFWSAPKSVLTQARPNTWGDLILDGMRPQSTGTTVVNTANELQPAIPQK
jgi:hypothetical protein